VRRRCQGAYDHRATGWEAVDAVTAQVAEPTLDPVADDGVADATTDHEAHQCGACVVVDQQVHDEGAATVTSSGARDSPQVGPTGEAVRRGQHGTEPASRAQTARLLRPLRRREDKMARPARVRMRSRNPCTLWRRRLFGWYVRLLTSILRWCCAWTSRRQVGPVVRWTRTVLDETACRWWNGVSAGTAHPRSALEFSPANRPWTCGTRRHRVTEERYARRSRQVKSSSRRPAAARAPVDTGSPAGP
jgi:hypothetical protein